MTFRTHLAAGNLATNRAKAQRSHCHQRCQPAAGATGRAQCKKKKKEEEKSWFSLTQKIRKGRSSSCPQKILWETMVVLMLGNKSLLTAALSVVSFFMLIALVTSSLNNSNRPLCFSLNMTAPFVWIGKLWEFVSHWFHPHKNSFLDPRPSSHKCARVV